MEEKGRETITAFDKAFTTNRIQMMKVFLSYLAPELQSGLAVYIKFSELQYAMRLARQFPGRPLLHNRSTVLSFQSLMDGSLFGKDQAGVIELLDELLPFSSPGERSRIQNLKNMLISISQMREMMDMMDMMKELFPEGMDDGNGSFEDMMDPSTLMQFMQMFQSPSSGNSDKDTDNEDVT